MKAQVILTFLLISLISGCSTPQLMPSSDIRCRVIDDKSNKPIAYAQLFMVYIGGEAGDKTIMHGPFFTDQNGEGRIKVDREIVWNSEPPGFNGGYIRHVEVHANGYKPSFFWEHFKVGLIEQEAPLTFKLIPLKDP